jgi:hypothetical protein
LSQSFKKSCFKELGLFRFLISSEKYNWSMAVNDEMVSEAGGGGPFLYEGLGLPERGLFFLAILSASLQLRLSSS